jgi:hypothetical protein
MKMKGMRGLCAALLLVFMTMTIVPPAFAGEGDAILKILMRKGIITDAEYKAITEELKAKEEEKDVKLNTKIAEAIEYNKPKEEEGWSDKIKLAGELSGEYRWMKRRDISDKRSDSTSDLYVRELKLVVEATLAEWMTAYSVLNSEWIGDSVNNSADSSNIAVDEAMVILKGEDFPLYLEIGKRPQPFGAFYNQLVTEPMSQDGYETKKVGVTVGFKGLDWLDLSATVYKGEEQMQHLFASNLFDNTNIKRPSSEWTSGSSDQLRSATDDVGSYILTAKFNPLPDELNFAIAYLSEEGHQKRNTTLGATLQYTPAFLKGFTLESEYMTALQRERYRSSAADIFNQAFKEKVLVLGAAYNITDPLKLGVRYEHFDDDGMANAAQSWSVDNRYSLGAVYTFYKDEEKGLSAFVGTEYRYTDYRLHSSQTAARAKNNQEMYLKLGVAF